MTAQLRTLLYLICVLTDFSGFLVIFTVSRTLADAHTPPWYLGLMGAGFSFTAAIGSLAGGLLSSRFGGARVFLTGASLLLGAALSLWSAPHPGWFLPCYWLMGIGIGSLYPPLISWLNQGDDPHTNHRGVSRRLILFCIAWNLGMLIGQLVGGSLYSQGIAWTIGTAFVTATLNLLIAIGVTRLIPGLPQKGTSLEDSPVHPNMDIAVRFKRLSWIANLGGVFGGSLVIHLLPDLMVLIQIPPDEHGKLLACWRGVIILTYLAMHVSRFWHYRLSVSLGSQLLGACGLVVISQASSPGMLFIGLTLLGQLVGFNYFSGLYYSTAGSSHSGRALSAGIHEATLATGMALGTIAGGVVGSVAGHRVPYFMAACVLLILILIQLTAWRASRRVEFSEGGS